MRITNQCSIYIVFGKKKARIPVNPEELEIKYPTDHKKYDVLGIGQIAVPRKPALKEVSWEGFFPGDLNATYVNSRAKRPEYYIKLLENALKKKQVCRLIISRSGLYDTNMKCLVSDFVAKDKGGEIDDVYYSISLLEYRPYYPERVSVVNTSSVSDSSSVQASAEADRPFDAPVLRVGAAVIVNGAYCNDSFGAKPHGMANNLSTTVTRIVSGNPYPVHIGHYGWVQESQLQITG